jgi:serine/threonine protein kinase
MDRRLGEGGMAFVYQVCHLGLQRTFALKLIRALNPTDPKFLRRFRIEAEALGKLKHLNIVDVTDFGIDPRNGGLPYLVMEYLEGVTLAERLREGPLPLHEALPILNSIAAAIDFAHDKEVLHRDIKPANVFLCRDRPEDDRVKVVDFGIARLLEPSRATDSSDDITEQIREGDTSDEPQPETTASVEDSSRRRALAGYAASQSKGLTQAGAVVGSVPYLAPETIAERTATRASDIYSFGVLVYQALVGAPPFEGSRTEVLHKHLHAPPFPPSALNRSLPEELDAAVLAPLEKPPRLRPSRAADVVRGIQESLRHGEAKNARARAFYLRRRVSLLIGLLLTGFSSFLWRSSAVTALERRTIDARFHSLFPRPPDPRILLVSLDNATLEADATPLTQRADAFGQQLERVFAAGAGAVAVDLLLPETWKRSEPFSQLVLKRFSSLTLAALSDRSGAVIGPECVAGLTAAALGPNRTSELFGLVNVERDPDGLVRQARSSYRDQAGSQRLFWAARAAWTFLKKGEAPRAIVGGSRAITDRPSGTIWVDHSVDRSQFQRISWKDLPATLDLSGTEFSDRLVLIGGDFAGGGDHHPIPSRVAQREDVSGLILQALVVNTLLEGSRFRELGFMPSLVLSSLIGGLLVLAILNIPDSLTPLLLAVGLLVAQLVLIFLLFRWRGWILPMVGPISTVLLAGAVGLLVRRWLGPLPVRARKP